MIGDAPAGRPGYVFAALLLIALTAAVACSGEGQVYEHAGHRWEGRGYMNLVLTELAVFSWFTITVTGWKILGWIGALLFAGRWFIQAWHRKRHGTTELPTVFWVMSLIGAGLTCAYFIWGKNDSVGIIQNAFPASVAAWNLWLDLARRAKRG